MAPLGSVRGSAPGRYLLPLLCVAPYGVSEPPAQAGILGALPSASRSQGTSQD